MDEQMQQLIQMGQQIIQAAQQGDQQAAQIIQAAQQIQSEEQMQQVQQAAQQGDESAVAVMAVIIASQAAQSAKFGAKLNYIQSLRGICPDGYEIEYFKAGGQVCKKCVKKQKMSEGNKMTSSQNAIDAFKCGRKMKKKVTKNEAGGNTDFITQQEDEYFKAHGYYPKGSSRTWSPRIPLDKCGKKMKKAGKGCRVPFNGDGTSKKGVTKKSSDGTPYTQTQRNDGNNNVIYTRTYQGYKPINYVSGEDGASFYQDHQGRARVEDQDSLATMYHYGPIETARRFPPQKKKQIIKNETPTNNPWRYIKSSNSFADGSKKTFEMETLISPKSNEFRRFITKRPSGENDTIVEFPNGMQIGNKQPQFGIGNSIFELLKTGSNQISPEK